MSGTVTAIEQSPAPQNSSDGVLMGLTDSMPQPKDSTGSTPVVVNVGDSGPEPKKDMVVHPAAQPNTFPFPPPPVDATQPGHAAKPRRRKLADGVKASKTPTDSVKEDEKKISPTEKMDFIRAALRALPEVLKCDPYAMWKKDKSNNMLASPEIGFDCGKSSLEKFVFGKNVYPFCGTLLGFELLKNDKDFFIWFEAFYNVWDSRMENVASRLAKNPSAKEFELNCYEGINVAVQGIAEKTFTRIRNIKFVTPTKLLELKGAAPDHISETKITRISFMMGWVGDLEQAVETALKEFFKWLESVAVVKANMPNKTRSDVLLLFKCAAKSTGTVLQCASQSGKAISPDEAESPGASEPEKEISSDEPSDEGSSDDEE